MRDLTQVRRRSLSAGQEDPPGARRGRERRLGAAAGWVGEVLGRWRPAELRIARGFAECRGLSAEQLEDLYQETTLALLGRPYQSEEHLRRALRAGLKQRALNLHRDERRRTQILTHSGPDLLPTAQADEHGPERAALIREDRLIVSEFLTELTALEQRVFWLLAEGMKYRLIAKVLGVEVNQARNAARSCERKREHFQLLYDTGRLCRYRASTIVALQNGEATSEELARRAFAHLESCASCRAEHRTNAKRLRRSFQGQAAGLLPVPALLGRLRWLVHLDVRIRTLQHRLTPDGMPFGSGGVRERAAALLAGSGVAAKVAAGVATVAVIAGGTIGATHLLNHEPARHRHRRSSEGRASTESQPDPVARDSAAGRAAGQRARPAHPSHSSAPAAERSRSCDLKHPSRRGKRRWHATRTRRVRLPRSAERTELHERPRTGAHGRPERRRSVQPMSPTKFVGRFAPVAVIDHRRPHRKGPEQGWTRP